MLTDFEKGVLLGLLVGEGHFGGDGKQAQVTLRMHVRHKRVFEWLTERFPGSKLYGPYTHGGRNYYQWMIRGKVLREELIPVLDACGWWRIDDHSYERYVRMKKRYGLNVEHADE
ncbi:hypothetical protein [Meiothermus rufus]|uniref:hypothetical protein n=1 Tax=Meiothermus rufus TaxID=604332 RepID=UPI001FE15B3F|nr:hypothetical protein [Meiothermus rufus]